MSGEFVRAIARPTPEQLVDSPRYVLIDELAHDNLVPNVRAYLRRASAVKTAYIVVNIGVAMALALAWMRTRAPLSSELPNLCVGMMVGYFTLMPIHEWVHALCYRRLGATGTRIVFDWRRATAYCVADGFVVTGREFAVVALAPFVVINTILILVIAMAGGFHPILWGMLVLHVGACSGDVALVNYVWLKRPARLFTYDDVGRKTTYFYAGRDDSEAASPRDQ